MPAGEVATHAGGDGRTGSTRNAADALVLALAQQGVDYVFLNPGTDTAPVQEALARCAATGLPPDPAAAAPAGRAAPRVPRVVLCPHEAVALAAAHAYFAVTGRPQVVMVHVDVGTQNLGSMLHNAYRGEAGVVVLAGRTPYTWQGEQPGGRDLVVHWHQDVPDQAGIVRPYVKWSGDLHADTLPIQVARAFQVARSGPCGPVYLTAAREVLMQPASDTASAVDVARFGPAAPTSPDPGALAEAAGLLAHAQSPVVATSRVGRDPGAVADLVRLAELLGAPVLDRRERMNIPTTHPCYVADGADGEAWLRDADVLLVVDSDVPWVPLRSAPSGQASVIHVDADPTRASMPGWCFPADVRIQSDPRLCLRQLTDHLSAVDDPDVREAWRRRWAALEARGTGVRTTTPDGDDPGPLCAEDVVEALNDLLRDEDIVIDETVTSFETLRRHLRRTHPGSLLQSGGSGLGWAVPGAVGAKLAAPESRVVAVVGDGSFVFSAPTASLMAALHADAPVLVVVLQNGGYAASSRPVHELFPDAVARGGAQASGEVLGTRFTAQPDFATLAQAFHAHAEHARHSDEIADVLARAFDALDQRTSALVVAHVGSPWLPDAAATDATDSTDGTATRSPHGHPLTTTPPRRPR